MITLPLCFTGLFIFGFNYLVRIGAKANAEATIYSNSHCKYVVSFISLSLYVFYVVSIMDHASDIYLSLGFVIPVLILMLLFSGCVTISLVLKWGERSDRIYYGEDVVRIKERDIWIVFQNCLMGTGRYSKSWDSCLTCEIPEFNPWRHPEHHHSWLLLVWRPPDWIIPRAEHGTMWPNWPSIARWPKALWSLSRRPHIPHQSWD